MFSFSLHSQTNKSSVNPESIENDIAIYTKKNWKNFVINSDRLKEINEISKLELKSHVHDVSKKSMELSMIELKKYELRKKYFKENPESLEVFTSKINASNTALQTCTDGDFENWPAANPFVFRKAVSPTGIIGNGQNMVTTDPLIFLPFNVNNTVNNFTASATLVDPGIDPNVSSVQRVFLGSKAIKLNFADTNNYEIVTMSRNIVINQNFLDFNYSVILNDPGASHTLLQKPFFLVRIYDVNNNVLRSVNVLTNPSDCSLNNTTAAPFSGSILTSGWQCARINTADLVAQNVRLEFIVADCSFGGHFGTVYIDNICNSNCANPLFGTIDLNPRQTIFCPTTNQTICGTYQIPFNSTYGSIALNVLQNNVIVGSVATPSTLTSSAFCFTVPITAFGSNPNGNFEFQVVGNFTRQCTINFQLDPIIDSSANDTGPDVTFSNPLTIPTFTQVASVCSGSTFSIPTISNNGITGTWSPTLNNTTTTTYTFTPNANVCATTAIMTVVIQPRITPLFNQVPPICKGGTPTLWPPTPTNVDIEGVWTPAFNSNTTTTYTFTPNIVLGQCYNNASMTVQVNSLLAVNDIFTGTPINNLVGGQTASVLNNDLVNGILINNVSYPVYITMTNIVVTPALTFIPSISINSVGNIILPAGTPVGTYTITYSIIDPNCRNTNISTATATIIVNSIDIQTPVLTPGIRANDIVSNVDTQSNGSIIISGYFTTYNNISCKKIARLNTNLTLDQTFNVDGPNPIEQIPWDMKVIKNTGNNYNKIIIGGSFSGWGTGSNGIAIARLNVDGTIDTSFNSGALANSNALRGFYTSLTSSTTKGTVFAIYVIPDGFTNAGKILVGGQFNRYNGYEAYNLALLNADGSFDTTSSFNTNVNTIINSVPIQATKGFNSAVGGIITQSDNKVLVAGAFDWYNGVPKSGLLRLNVNGTLDTFYNSATVFSGLNPGFVSGSLGSGYAAFHKKLVLQPDGKLIVGGYFGRYNNNTANNIVRINTDGSIDSGFVVGSGFKNDVINTITSEPGIVRDLVLDTNATNNWLLYAAGDFLAYQGATCNEIIRIKCSTFSTYTAGNNDVSGFNLAGGGPNGSNNGPVWCMKRQPGDSKIIIGGRFTNYNGIPALNVTRILPVSSGFTNEAKNAAIYYDSEPEIDLFSTEKVIIYPNPNDGNFNIKLNNEFFDNTTLLVYDLMGRKVYENKMLNNVDSKVNLSDLNKGTYFVTLRNNMTENTITKTVIIK